MTTKPPGDPRPVPDPDGSATDPCDLTAVEQRRLLDDGRISARELLTAHRSRIETVDPLVNAVVTRSWEAAEIQAARCDQAHARGERLGVLHGLVTAFKDLADTAGVRTTYGSPVFADHIPTADAPLVARIKAAGAVAVGKTNTPEFGAGSHTFNPVFGVTRNPWDLSRSAGGSSGGAAVAVATGMVSLADGSDVGGSLRNPPSFCGVVGLRPTPGRIPDPGGPAEAYLRFPVSGPIGRCVADVALGLSAMAGPQPGAVLSLPEPGSRFGPPLDGRGLPAGRPVRVAYSPTLGGLPVDAEVRAAVAAAAAALQSLGWEVEEADPPLTGVDECFETIRAWMSSALWGARLGDQVGRAKASVRLEITDGARLTGPQVFAALQMHTRLVREAAAFLAGGDNGYHLLLCPTAQALPFPVEDEWVAQIDGVRLARYTDWMRSCSRITVLGLPSLSLPVGRSTNGLPIGAQLAAAPGADRLLLDAAQVAERAWGRLGAPPVVTTAG